MITILSSMISIIRRDLYDHLMNTRNSTFIMSKTFISNTKVERWEYYKKFGVLFFIPRVCHCMSTWPYFSCHLESLWDIATPWDVGLFTQKPLGHGCWMFLNSHWLRVSWPPTLGLHEGNFGLQPMTFLWRENSHMASIDNVDRDCKRKFQDNSWK